MSKEMIIMASMLYATLVTLIIKILKNLINKVIYNNNKKRTKYLKKLVEENKIEIKIINWDMEKHRVLFSNNGKTIIIDGKSYGNKNSFILMENEKIYILGKKENFAIALIKEKI